jgi:hypothetical protein
VGEAAEAVGAVAEVVVGVAGGTTDAVVDMAAMAAVTEAGGRYD